MIRNRAIDLNPSRMKDQRPMNTTTSRWVATLVALGGLAGGFSGAADLPASSVGGSPVTSVARLEWRFDSQTLNAAPEVVRNAALGALGAVAPGRLSSGWHRQIAAFGSVKTGYWDLGQGGKITLSVPARAGAATGTRTITVRVCQWNDGVIYSAVTSVSVAGGTLVASQILNDTPGPVIGNWIVFQTDWEVPAGASPTAIEVVGAAGGSLVDGVSVETTTSAGPIVDLSVLLSIARSASDASMVEVSWPAGIGAVTLESTTSLNNPVSWEPVTAEVQPRGERSFVAVKASEMTHRVFRLVR